MSPNEPYFSKQNMSGAIALLAPYLSPTPSFQEKKSFDYSKYSILDNPKDNVINFVEEIIMNGVIASSELILLVVECITRSGESVKKAMFRLNEQTQLSGGKFVFIKWLSFAIDRIEQRQKAGDVLVPGESRVEEMIVGSIMELICSFSVIKKEKQLGVLKNKFGVDWISIVQQVRRINNLIYVVFCFLYASSKCVTYQYNLSHVDKHFCGRTQNIIAVGFV